METMDRMIVMSSSELTTHLFSMNAAMADFGLTGLSAIFTGSSQAGASHSKRCLDCLRANEVNRVINVRVASSTGLTANTSLKEGHRRLMILLLPKLGRNNGISVWIRTPAAPHATSHVDVCTGKCCCLFPSLPGKRRPLST